MSDIAVFSRIHPYLETTTLTFLKLINLKIHVITDKVFEYLVILRFLKKF
jgi:hypothetical protein